MKSYMRIPPKKEKGEGKNLRGKKREARKQERKKAE